MAEAQAISMPVRVAIPAGLPPPLLFEKEEELTGIVPEYSRALIDILGRQGTLSLVPRNRLVKYLHQGAIDFLCYTSYAWTNEKDTYNWSEALFVKRELILGPTPMPKEISGLKGKTIGTMLAYVYPKLDKMFKDGDLIREDGPTEEANLLKLREKHIEYLIVDEVFLNFYKKKNPDIEKGRDRLFLSEYSVSCSLSKKSRVTVKELNKAIAKLKSSGKLRDIFDKHGTSVLK
jgi:polar amino acid transport system substrate-binding protein